MIPTFKFHGSKARSAKYIFVDIKTINNYYEPFAGRGNCFFYVASHFAYKQSFLNDLYLSKFLIALRDYQGDFSFVPEFIDRNIYNYFFKMQPCFERDLAESFCAYNGTFWGGGANLTNSPSHQSKNRHSKQRTISRMTKAKELLKNSNIAGIDYRQFLKQFEFKSTDLVYCDPPYEGTSINSKVGPNINHEELAIILNKLPCRVILSGYESSTYDKILKSFTKKSFKRASCGRNSGGGSFIAIEFIWRNF